MEVPGECALCGAHGLVRTCQLCGSQVCARDYDPGAACCVRCARKPRTPTGTAPAGPEPAQLPELPDDAGDRFT